MRRRLEVARGLLHQPQVLFLDEPTLGLDPQSRSRIWEYVQALKRQEGTTVFLTTHNMEEAERADRVAILDRGRLIALDTPEALRRLVGGDIITLRTADDRLASQRIQERWGFQVRSREEGLCFEAPLSGELVPALVEQLGLPVHFVSTRSRTLNDAFLALTGREMHEDQAGDREGMRRWLKRRRWSGRY
jgi:ABC-2 type transport system ATP-binding protein